LGAPTTCRYSLAITHNTSENLHLLLRRSRISECRATPSTTQGGHRCVGSTHRI
jgi:hypothetical protein